MDAAWLVIARSIGALVTRLARRFARTVTNGGLPRGLIVAFIAGEPGMAERMLAEHRDDGSGHCRVCGPQSARKVWPCPLYEYALSASQQEW